MIREDVGRGCLKLCGWRVRIKLSDELREHLYILMKADRVISGFPGFRDIKVTENE